MTINKPKIFITGASGCIGHYVIDALLSENKYEIYLLLRDPSRLKFDYKKYPDLIICKGDMDNIENFQKELSTINYLIHIATDWSDSDFATRLNVEKTHKMFDFCDPDHCQKILYFSTASILGKNNTPIIEAEKYGTGYIKSKYLAYKMLPECKLADRIYTFFPTLVFGGGKNHPYSHLSAGVPNCKKYLYFLRFFYMDSAFHFLHSQDIATVVKYVLENNVKEKNLVLGNEVITGKKTIEIMCKKFRLPIYFRLKVKPSFLFFLAKLFKVKVSAWDRFCINYPFFEYNTVNPATFGLKTEFPTLESLLTSL
jgi:nucleoside-diphosphate-sugar epimerase